MRGRPLARGREPRRWRTRGSGTEGGPTKEGERRGRGKGQGKKEKGGRKVHGIRKKGGENMRGEVERTKERRKRVGKGERGERKSQ